MVSIMSATEGTEFTDIGPPPGLASHQTLEMETMTVQYDPRSGNCSPSEIQHQKRADTDKRDEGS